MTWKRDVSPELLDILGAAQTPFKAPDAGLEEPEDEPADDDQFGWSDVEPYLDELPAIEQDAMRLYYGERLTQGQIAALFKIGGIEPATQAGVSYRIARGRKRVQFLRTIPPRTTDRDVFARDLEPWLPMNGLEPLWHYYRTTSQNQAALNAGVTFGKVRMKLVQFMRRMETAEKGIIEADNARGRAPEVPEVLARYLIQFRALTSHYNSLHGIRHRPEVRSTSPIIKLEEQMNTPKEDAKSAWEAFELARLEHENLEHEKSQLDHQLTTLKSKMVLCRETMAKQRAVLKSHLGIGDSHDSSIR